MAKGGLLTYKDRLYIPSLIEFKMLIMDEIHKKPYLGHRRLPKDDCYSKETIVLAWNENRYCIIHCKMH
jgi:hypothetical protein